MRSRSLSRRGLKWEPIGTTKPSKGTELENPVLAEALSAKTEFSPDEWEKFGVSDLAKDHYIRSALGAYLQPAGVASKEASTWPNMRLYLAARDGREDEVRQALLLGASVHERNPWVHFTPMMVAAYRGHARIVSLLLASGARATERGPAGETPLHFAAGFGDSDTCQVLLTEGNADPFVKDDAGDTPLARAQRNGRGSVVELIESTRRRVKDLSLRTVAKVAFAGAVERHQRALTLSRQQRARSVRPGSREKA